MKKTTAPIIILSALSLKSSAQSQLGTGEVISILSGFLVLLVIYVVAFFVLTLIRQFLADRLKKIMIEKEVSPEVIAQLLPRDQAQKVLALKWCCLFSALGLGLLLIYFFRPVGLHSVIILSFSLAAGFFVYYLLMRGIRV